MTFRKQSLLIAVAVLPGLLLAGCDSSSTSNDLASIVITPSPVRLTMGGVGQLVVTGVYGDGTRAPINTGLVFSSSAPDVAAVSSSGVVTALGIGSATVTATASGKVASVTVTVASTAATLVAIDIVPPSALLGIRGTEQLTVSGTYSDFSTVNVTAGSTFVSSSPGVATISAAGLVTAVAAGSTTIVATHTASGKIATATIFVTGGGAPPTLASIAVTPPTVSLAPARTQQLTVTGTYSDSSTANLTSGSTFASSATSVATVSAAGLVTAVANGTATITVTASGKTSTASVTVSSGGAPTLSSIAVTPASVALAPGGSRQLTVTGTYSDSSTANLTSASTFVSSATGVATVSAAGLVTAVAAGTCTITATHTASGKTATSAVTVSTATTTGGLVFFDGFDPGVTFVDFGGAANNVSVDTVEKNNGRNSLKFVVTSGTSYSGGAFVASLPRNLSAFNALTFWAKASTANTLPVTGIGNDAATPQNFSAESLKIPLTGTWTKYIIPIPVPSKLTSNAGLFHLADGQNKNYTIWLNDIQYETLGASEVGPPTLTGTNVGWEAGTTTVAVNGVYQIPYEPNTVGFALPVLPNAGRLTNVSFRYFDLASSAPSVATVSAGGLVTGVTAGAANITATLGGLAVPGQQAITVSGTAAAGPAVPAAAPTVLPADAISLFSSTFTGTAADKSANVDTWFTSWSCNGNISCSLADYTIPGTTHVVKKYVIHNFFGVELIGTAGANQIDIATPGMTNFHMDVWSPDGSQVTIKLIDAGADKVVGTADDSVKITLGGHPFSPQSQWVSVDLDIAAMSVQLAGWNGKNIAQIVVALDVPTTGGTLYVDNVYFYKGAGGGGGGGGGAGPTAAPTAPTAPVANVLSLFSSTYSGTAADKSANVNSYNATCFGPGGSSVADYTIPGTSHVVKQYTVPANNFGIIELIGAVGGTPSPPDSAICFGGSQSTTGSTLIDVTTMTGGLRFDIWSPGGSTQGANQQVVSADATNTIAGPGAAPGASQGTSFASGTTPVAAGQWVTVDFPWSSSGPPGAPAGLNKVALVKFFFLDGGTYYIDNIYFYK